MTSLGQGVTGSRPVRRFSVNNIHGVRAHMDVPGTVPEAAQYVARLAVSVGELLEFGSLAQLHLTGPDGNAVLLIQTTTGGAEVMRGALAGSDHDPAILAGQLIAQIRS